MHLMLQDKEVLELDKEFNLVKIVNNVLLPYALIAIPYLSTVTASMYIQNWLVSRLLPTSRTHYKQLMLSAGLNQSNRIQKKLEIVQFCHGVKINDCYWLRLNKSESYTDYNIYEQPLTQDSIDVALNGEVKQLTIEDLLCDLTTDGTFPKAWTRKEDGLYLLKSAYPDKDVSILDFINSEINSASYAASNTSIDVVCYTRTKSADNRDCTICKCFTNDDIMFIPYDDCETKFETLEQFVKQFKQQLEQMFRSDIEVNQIDRHGGNFGVLASSKTNEVLGFAPLFDYNLSGIAAQKLMHNTETAYCEPFKMNMLEALEYVKNTN